MEKSTIIIALVIIAIIGIIVFLYAKNKKFLASQGKSKISVPADIKSAETITEPTKLKV